MKGGSQKLLVAFSTLSAIEMYQSQSFAKLEASIETTLEGKTYL